MFRFLAYLQVTPRLKQQIKVSAVICSGVFLGYLKAIVVNDKYENVNEDKLVAYQNEDQINTLIQQQKIPAVIYYYLPQVKQHSFFRQMMFKYSNKYPDNAVWTMVNLTKKFQQAKASFDLQYPTRVRLQVRFPKSNVAIKISEQDQFLQFGQKTNRREGFKFNYDQEGFKKFLQDNRIISGTDPLKAIVQVTNKSLFRSTQTNTLKNQ